MEDLSMEEESLEQNFLHLKKKLFGVSSSLHNNFRSLFI